jgi:hypothetical protein
MFLTGYWVSNSIFYQVIMEGFEKMPHKDTFATLPIFGRVRPV